MGLSFDEQDRAKIQEILGKYPQKAAALLPVLHLAQTKFGHLAPEAQLLVADAIDVPPTRVREVVTFYEMFHEHPEGQFHLELCTNISCHLLGGEELLEHLSDRLGIRVGHMTEDGLFSLMEVECLASCGSGPCMKVGEDYYEGLTAEAVDALIETFKKAASDLGGRPYVCGSKGPHTGPVAGFASKLPVLQPNPDDLEEAEIVEDAQVMPVSDGSIEPISDPEAAPVEEEAADAPEEGEDADPKEGGEAEEASESAAEGEENPSNLPSFDPPPLKKKEPEA